MLTIPLNFGLLKLLVAKIGLNWPATFPCFPRLLTKFHAVLLKVEAGEEKKP